MVHPQDIKAAGKIPDAPAVKNWISGSLFGPSSYMTVVPPPSSSTALCLRRITVLSELTRRKRRPPGRSSEAALANSLLDVSRPPCWNDWIDIT